MLDRRATLIVWGFLLGVILFEGWGLYAGFGGPHAAASLARYLSRPPGTPLAWGLAALATVLYVAYAAYGSDVIRLRMFAVSRWRPYAAIRLAAIPMALVSGLFEEAFFRKMAMDLMAHHGAGAVAQIVLSALVFGVAHAIWGLMGGSLRGALGPMLATTAMGAMLAAVYIVGGRAIAPCIAAHIAINLLIEPWLIMTAATHSWKRRRAAPVKG